MAARERDRITTAIAGGASPEELIAGYIEEHGAQVRIVPERTGFNMIGFAVPFAASIAALLTLLLVLRAWKRHPRLRPAVSTPPVAGTADASYLDRLNRDLEDYD